MNADELIDELSMQNRLRDLHSIVEKIRQIVRAAVKIDPDRLPTLKDRVDFDLFLAYAANSLFWIHLKLNGVDPVALGIKTQLNRIKDCMAKVKQAHERQTIRPKLDKPAAERFVMHGIGSKGKRKVDQDVPQNKKTKFDD